ncbi:hypothetical protein [Nocardia abscessus]|uniref:hypothetical protein n=1 Tax=Nocardia abscessus TaxID=120957 RepID=UPI002453902F|nr:hypothetical protein [Nocardia abscessus]
MIPLAPRRGGAGRPPAPPPPQPPPPHPHPETNAPPPSRAGLDVWITYWLFAAFYAALSVGVVFLGRATPPMRRGVELLEYTFVAAVLPLAVWVADLYSDERGL